MSAVNWSLTDNVFDNVTKKNYSKMYIIAKYTKAVLTARQSDPGIATILATFGPICDAYATTYENWIESQGEQIGSTAKVKGLLKLLQSKYIRQWDVAIQQVYDVGSEAYIRLLPNRRTPFQIGKQSSRLSVVAALDEAIGSDPALATLKGTIQSFHNTLNDAVISQHGNKGIKSILSLKTEAARLAAAEGLMGVFCSLGLLNLGNLKNVDAYFDLRNIQNKRQTTYTAHIPVGEFKFVLLHTFKDTDKFTVKNTGDAILDFGLCQNRHQAFTSAPYFSAAAHSNSTCTGSQIIKGRFRFLMVMNKTDKDGSFELTTDF